MIIDTKEASRRLGVCRTRVQQLLIAGRIPGKKIGRRYGEHGLLRFPTMGRLACYRQRGDHGIS